MALAMTRDAGMDLHSLLIFELSGARYAVDATQVRETVWLPELTPAAAAPAWVVGLFSLRGQIVPVCDPGRLLGRPPRRRRPEDQVLVLEIDHQPLGLIVDQAREVVDVAAADIQPPPRYEGGGDAAAQAVLGEAWVGDALVTLLDAARLARAGESSPLEANEIRPEDSAAARAVFHARAAELMREAGDTEDDRLELAVIELGGETFAVELAAVREFIETKGLTPLPCCPPHILGALGVRGELVVLLDPRAGLGLPGATEPPAQALLAPLGDGVVAVALDAVNDVVYPSRSALLPAPAQLRARHGAEVLGTLPWGDGAMTVLDLPALLARPEWIVEEHV